MRERIERRLRELQTSRASVQAQLESLMVQRNAHDGAIQELEHLISESGEPNKKAPPLISDPAEEE